MYMFRQEGISKSQTHCMQHCIQVVGSLQHCTLLGNTGYCSHPVVVHHIEGIRHSPVRPGHLGSSFDSGILPEIDHSLRIAGSSDQVGKIVLLAGMSLRLGGNWQLLLLVPVLAVEGCCSGSSVVFGGRYPPEPRGRPPMS